MSADDSAVLLPSGGANDKNLLDEKLRSLIRTSEINLTRIPPPTRSLSSASDQSPASPAASSKHTITISITSSSTSHQSAGSVAVNCNPSGRPADGADEQQPAAKKKKKRKDTAPVVQQHVIYAAPAAGRRNGSLFRHRLDDHSGDEDESPLHDQFDMNLPLPAVTFFTRDSDIEDLGEFRMTLISQKWVLSKWIGLKRKQLQRSAAQARREMELEKKRSLSAMDCLLEESGARITSSIRNGICCFSTDDFVCSKPSLPYTRHCKEHILYNVDQLLFTRCTAKSAASLTQCSCATFDIEHDEPVCEYHMRCGVEVDGGKCVRKRTKQMALTRPARRKKRKGKGSDNAGDGTEDKMLPPPPYPTSLTDSDIPAALDVGIPNLGPGDEALVASLVDDLGPLPLGAADHSSSAFDAELTDVLNKMPVDAFHELFADHPIKGSASETDAAIDQSFGSKTCHISNGDTTYPFMSHHSPVTSHMNGHIPPPAVHSSPRPLLNSTPLPNDDLVNNILGFLTTEQQQQLNGLIDGALASGSLTSPTLKHAPAVLDQPFADTADMPLLPASFKSTNSLPGSQVPDSGSNHLPVVSAAFAQFSPRLSGRGTYPNAAFTPTTGSLLITGLNEASIGRSNQFVRLSDIRLNHQAAASQSPVKNNCIPRPHAPAAHTLPPLAARDKNSS